MKDQLGSSVARNGWCFASVAFGRCSGSLWSCRQYEPTFERDERDIHGKTSADELVGFGRESDIGRERRAHALGAELRFAFERSVGCSSQDTRTLTLNMAAMKPSPSHGRDPASISMQMHPSDQMSAFAE